MLQCLAVCCSVLQCVAVCCCVLQCVSAFRSRPRSSISHLIVQNCGAWQCVAVCCSVLLGHSKNALAFHLRLFSVVVYCRLLRCTVLSVLQCVAVWCCVLQRHSERALAVVYHIFTPHTAAWCSVLQCAAVCFSVLQCASVCCRVL